MCSSSRAADRPHRITSLGLLLLVFANITTYLLTRHSNFSEHVVDPVAGFMMGAAIAVLLLGIYKQGRSLRT